MSIRIYGKNYNNINGIKAWDTETQDCKTFIAPEGTLNISSNGETDVTSYASVNVNIPTSTVSLQQKTVSPSTSQQIVTADTGYNGLSQVTISAMPSMTLPSAATASATSGFTSKATISRSTADQYINIPTGYNNTNSYYKINAVANGSATAPNTISGDQATVTTGTNTLTLSKTVSVTPNVSAGYISNGTSGNSAVSLTANITTKSAATITPSTTNQTVAAGTYLTGTQTIAGDADLIATNIKSGVQIFGVTGTYTGEGVNLQSKTGIAPSTSSQTIIPDSGYDGLSSVQINAMPSGSVSVPNTTITANPTLSTTYTSGSGYQITVSKTQTVNPSVTAGYVSAGTGGTMTVSGSAYVAQSAITNNTTLPSGSTSSGTINFGSYIKIGAGYYPTDRYYRSYSTTGSVTTPSSISGSAATLSTGSGTLTLTKTVSVTPNVTTAGYITSGTAGNSSVSLTANVTTKAAATITPGTSNQTISAGTYLTGTQTISGDTDLVAANIKSGVTIFNTTGSFTSDATAGASEIISGATAYVDGEKVTGTLVVNRCYISSSNPSSSLGNNGDIFIQE